MSVPNQSLSTARSVFLANWGGYYPLQDSLSLFEKLVADCSPFSHPCHLAIPYDYLDKLPENIRSSGLIFGADHILSMEEGAFTGSIALELLKKARAKFVLVNGNHQSLILPKMLKAVIQEGIIPFICIGESSLDMDAAQSKQDLAEKLSLALQDISPHQLLNLNIIYEAPWMDSSPFRPEKEKLIIAYQRCKEALQTVVGIQVANGIRLLCAVPYDLEDLPSLIKEGEMQGLYLAKAVFHQNQLHRMFASDLHLHGEFEMPHIEDKILSTESIVDQPLTRLIEDEVSTTLNDEK